MKLHTLQLICLILLVSNSLFAGNPSQVYWSLDQCQSNLVDGTNQSYDEFIPEVFNSDGCSQLTMVNPTLYRNNPTSNTHSCAPGIEGSTAMCINSYAGCFYVPNKDEALRFNVRVTPDPTGVGRLSTFSFQEMAPETFSYIDGVSGPNNYPTKYALRIEANGVEVFKQVDIPTSLDWTLEEFDLSSLPAFTVNTTTIFNFELLPYCFVGNGYGVSAWDIDDILLTSACGDGITIGGSLTTYQGALETSICINGTTGNSVPFTVTGAVGQISRFIITDTNGNILSLPAGGSTFDFSQAGPGVCRVYHVSHEGSLIGAEVGGNIANLVGCFDLSNYVTVTRNTAIAGSINSNGETTINLCGANDSPVIPVSLSGNVGAYNYWLLTDASYNVISVNAGPPFDVSNVAGSTCYILNLSTSDASLLPVPGMNINTIGGCYGLSNPIVINKENATASSITTSAGSTVHAICDQATASNFLDVIVTGGMGGSAWIITDPQGVIIDVQPAPPFNLSNVNINECQLWLVRTSGNLQNFAIGNNVNAIDGCFALSNPIDITKVLIGAPTITTNGVTSASICYNTATSFSIPVNSGGGTGTSSNWLITDTNGNILDTPAGPPFDFTNAGVGVCYIYEVSYDGTLSGNTIGNNVSQLAGCYGLSNPITVTRTSASGGSLTAPDGTGTYNFCSSNGQPSVSPTLTGNAGNSQWLITDTNNNILDLQAGLPINLENITAPVCYIYHLGSDGATNAAIGMNTSAIGGCFGLSNPILVDKTEVQAGSISINGQTTVSLCLSSSSNNVLSLTSSGTTSGEIYYLITDGSGNILATQADASIDFSAAGPGTCQVYQLAASGGVTGAGVGDNISNISGCHQISNAVTVVRENIIGGTINTGSQSICLSDDISNVVTISVSGQQGLTSQFLVVDVNNNIQFLSSSPNIDFGNLAVGSYFVYHVASNGTLGGLNVGQTINNLTGCFALSNSVNITNVNVTAGTISSTLGSTISICVGDGVADLVDVAVAGNSGANNSWVITDAAGTILELPAGPPFDFDGAGVGTCLIWHLSYNDGLSGATVGANANNLTGCYGLSNPITVERTQADGGTLILPDNTFETSICVGDGISDALNVNLESNSGTYQQWVITDTQGNILDLPVSPPFDFEGAGPGVCQIWNLAYSGSIAGVTIGANVSGVTGCHDFSNPITVNRTATDGGAISTPQGTTIYACVGDGVADNITATVTGNYGSFSQWLITDQAGVILELPAGPNFNFEEAGLGTCLIWHLSYESGLIGFGVGQNANNFVGCHDLSNPITVIRTQAEGGAIALGDGSTAATICVGDGLSDSMNVTLTGNSGENSAWVITDSSGNILDLPAGPPFDLEGAGAGVCLIWHLSYQGTISGATIGANTTGLAGCYDLSNPITITRNSVEGGTLDTPFGTNFSVCVGDGVSDLVSVTVDGNQGSNSQWVITDSNGTILDLPAGPPFEFDNAGFGVCLIWHLSFENGLTGAQIGLNANDLSGCYALSNPITVNRSSAEGGSLTTLNGITSANLCVDDNFDPILDVILTGNSGQNCAWVVTDDQGTIIALPTSAPFDLSTIDYETCLIYNVCYGDGLIGLDIGWPLSGLSGCYDLSNSIFVEKNVAYAGSISTLMGSTFTLCTSDGVSDAFLVSNTGYEGDFSEFILTDSNGEILAIQQDGNFDLEGAPLGVCYIYFVAWNGPLNGDFVGSNFSSLSGCFDVSNRITVNREALNGGSLTTDQGLQEFTICSGDGEADPFDVLLSGNSSSQIQDWVITDEFGNILALPVAPPFDLEGAAAGTCYVWSITYHPGLLGLAIGTNTSALMGCYALSNPIIVHRNYVDGGIIAFDGGAPAATICVGDGVPDFVDVVVTDQAGSTCQFVVTNLMGDILELPTSSPLNLEGAEATTCLIYSVCYTEPLDHFAVGFNISKWTGCFDLSNAITLEKDVVDGGMLTTTEGTTVVDVCVGDGNPDLVNFALTGSGMNTSAWIITDDMGVILDLPTTTPIDFEGAGAGTCLVYHVDYTDWAGAVVGGTTADITGCYDFSNAVTVNRTEVNGGVPTLVDGTTTTIDLCIADGNADVLSFISNSPVMGSYQWVITDMTGNIIALPMVGTVDFEGTPAGVCLVYGVSYIGNFTAMIDDNIFTDVLADVCYNASVDPITINRFDMGAICTAPIQPEDGLVAFDLYPNPATDNLRVNIASMPEGKGGYLLIYNTVGEVIEKISIDGLSKYVDIDISSYTSGAYIIKMGSHKSANLKRFMKIN